jgi:aminopeptidase N
MKFLGLLFIALSLRAAAPDGIPRELARERAQRISNIRYHLHFDLVPHADETHGRETLTFSLDDNSKPLLLDFREGKLDSVAINGNAGPAYIDNGHIRLPAENLLPGANKIEIDFTAPVGPSGKAITRYEDKD